jgi:hypothetical protein
VSGGPYPTYLKCLITLYLFVTALVLLITDFSPFLFENYVVDWLPFLRTRYGKACMHIIAGSLCFDNALFGRDENIPNDASGLCLLLSGSFWALYYWGRTEANPSDYRGFQHPSTDLAMIIRNPLAKQ